MAFQLVEIKCEETLAFYQVHRNDREATGMRRCRCRRCHCCSALTARLICVRSCPCVQGYVKDVDRDLVLVAYEGG